MLSNREEVKNIFEQDGFTLIKFDEKGEPAAGAGEANRATAGAHHRHRLSRHPHRGAGAA